MEYFIYQLKLVPQYRKEANWTDQTKQIISTHFQYLKKHCDEGKVLLAGRTGLNIEDDNNAGICIFKAASPEAAREFMEHDPAVVNGVMTARVFPFSLAMLNTQQGEE